MTYPPSDDTPPGAPPWPPRAPTRHSWLLAITGAVLGLLGLIVGVAAWFRAAPSTMAESPVYSERQVTDAKNAVCEAYAKGVQSFQIAGNKKVDNPADSLPVAVNTRLAEVAVGNYLINSLEENPAAPEELKQQIQKLAKSYQEIALAQLADSSDYRQNGINADNAISRIRQICP